MFFWLALAFDTWVWADVRDGWRRQLRLRGTTGMIAIVLIFPPRVWATVVLLTRDDRWIAEFHKLRVAVWVIWLVPYLSPMFFALALHRGTVSADLAPVAGPGALIPLDLLAGYIG